MRMSNIGLFFVTAMVMTAIGPPQDPIAAMQRESDTGALKEASVRLPDGKGTWVARVIRTGGFSGSLLDAMLTSQGTLTCQSRDCPKAVSAETIQAMSPVFDPKTMSSAKSQLSGLCQSCFVTRLTVKHRDSDGKVHSYFVFWDDLTAARAPAGLVKLARDIVSLAK